jgi:hypothetical protein
VAMSGAPMKTAVRIHLDRIHNLQPSACSGARIWL